MGLYNPLASVIIDHNYFNKKSQTSLYIPFGLYKVKDWIDMFEAVPWCYMI